MQIIDGATGTADKESKQCCEASLGAREAKKKEAEKDSKAAAPYRRSNEDERAPRGNE